MSAHSLALLRLIQTHFIISPDSNWTTTQEWRLYLGFWSHWMFVYFSFFFWDLQLQGLSEFMGLLIFLFLKTLFLFIWLCWTLAVVHRIFSCSMWILPVGAWGIWFPDQGSNPDPLYWEHRILATGPPGNPCITVYWQSRLLRDELCLLKFRCWSLNPSYLRLGPYLEIRSLER